MHAVLLAALLALPVVTDEIVLDCASPCSVYAAPNDRFDRPSCTEYDFDSALIESMRRGDSSARELLKQRHDTMVTDEERLRIAGALLRHVDDDRAYWDEIFLLATNAILARSPEFLQPLSYDALDLAGTDARGRDLLVRALESPNASVVVGAISSIGLQHDESTLPIIEKAIQRFPGEHLGLALYTFHSPAAEALAKRVLSAEELEVYEQLRDEHLQ